MKRNLLSQSVKSAILLSLVLSSCKKAQIQTVVQPDMQPMASLKTMSVTSVSLTIASTNYNTPVPADFLGLSYEKSDLINSLYPYFHTSDATNSVLINMINGLGSSGVLRLGGNSADHTHWTNTLRGSIPKTSTDSLIYRDDAYALKQFMASLGSGWKLIYGLNLGTDTPKATEAQYVVDQWGTKVKSLEIGNEPDLWNVNGLRPNNGSYGTYGYGIINYKSEFLSNANSLNSSVTPAPPFSGPTVATKTTWIDTFATVGVRSKIKFLTTHYYARPSSPAPTVTDLLTYDSILVARSGIIKTDGTNSSLPWRYGECNSVNNGGTNNVSNAYVSALWGADFMFYLARKGCAGVNFHGGRRSYYSPINYSTTGVFTANPLYYAMLMFNLSNIDQPLDQTLNAGSLNLTAYSFKRHDGKEAVMIINKDANNGGSISISNYQTITQAVIHTLTAPLLTSKTGITLDNASVDTNGNWVSSSTTTQTNSSSNITINVPAATAVLVVFN